VWSSAQLQLQRLRLVLFIAACTRRRLFGAALHGRRFVSFIDSALAHSPFDGTVVLTGRTADKVVTNLLLTVKTAVAVSRQPL